jgi:hypothetical protein
MGIMPLFVFIMGIIFPYFLTYALGHYRKSKNTFKKIGAKTIVAISFLFFLINFAIVYFSIIDVIRPMIGASNLFPIILSIIFLYIGIFFSIRLTKSSLEDSDTDH